MLSAGGAVMKKSRKILLIALIILTLPILAYAVLTFDTAVLYPEYGDQIVEKFNNNRSDFEAISQYAEDTGGMLYVYADTRLFGKIYSYEPIESEEINEKIDKLVSELHYQVIQEIGYGCVLFKRVADNDEYGIAYCPSGKIHFRTTLEMDLGDGWFYYQTFHE